MGTTTCRPKSTMRYPNFIEGKEFESVEDCYRRLISVRGRRVVIDGFGSRKIAGHEQITMARNDGHVTQGCVLLAQGYVSCQKRGQLLLVGFLLIFQHPLQ